MARLVLPYKSSGFARAGLLGLISSVPTKCRVRFLENSARNISRYRRILTSETLYQRSRCFSYLSQSRVRQANRRLICSVATETLQKLVEEPAMDSPKEIFLKDYKMPDYYFDTVDLKFLLGEEKTIVSSKITVSPRVEGSYPLVLNGHDLKLVSIWINSKELKEGEYQLDSRHLTLPSPPSGAFTLEIVTEIYPQKNTSLEGLYKSSGNFCTQCEAEGFRKITFYQDRPDIMAKYTCRIEAEKSLYPVLLSNGNLIEQGDLEGGRHYALWEDPFKKPCYLFALVAGQLESRDDIFVTRSGRKVSLRIWTPAQDVPKTAHAMYSLKEAMKWDEDVFGLEYDLDLFNIVAVPDFNMGAMENKSLNIFNSKLVLASPETASDADHAAILGVIGHEYFHNWTGNRVTCRDWFQLSLKEGLTVFRDQEFSSDMGSRTVKRIADVSKLRNYQFPQDAGPMAHPVRPHSYIKMDNFYTVTVGFVNLHLYILIPVGYEFSGKMSNCSLFMFLLQVYEKGAEVVRMYKTLLGSQGFRKGMDLYFKRHDGQAVTCEDFFAAMRDANGADFANFLQWYSQAGTPSVKVSSSYNAEAHTFSLKFSQEVPPTPGQPVKEPMFIPVAVGLLDSTGKEIPLSSVYHDGTLQSVASNNQPVYTTVLRVTKKEEEFVFSDVFEQPVPSLLRGYSAPIRLESDLTDSDLFFLLAHDADEFNRWEAGQVLARKLMLNLVADFQQNKPLVLNQNFVDGLRSILSDSSLDKEFIAKAITLPGEGEIMDMMEIADPDAVHAVRTFIRKQLALELKAELLTTVEKNRSSEEYVFNHPNMARRALKNVALAYLALLEDPKYTELALHEYRTATNMTEQFSALVAIVQNPGKTRDDVLADFYSKWQHDFLVVNKWFALQAMSDIPGNVENVRSLLNHPAFDMRNPNKVYSLIGGFCGSPVNFHAKDGSGYKFLGEIVLQLDKLNPQVASRMVSAFSRWRRYDETRQNLAKAQLEKIMSTNGLSENVFEIASKSLAA
ncbi:puromycin-sensitive aminopeptidase isoform X2 [Juglans microcarpa x Juglans regia]|uniref:puromycin-sensitive aminopeptidase isoform X2 n=1 Tax=Juglans microcarpa x Juglans regia TaxID=2249226 RepID=UPI001B7DDDF0|nr:puromycin-sensitive aminopeptidase isoform X2 [Juglans microcarpa x Juglans regia]